jgi:hypothetical protein
MSEILKNGVFRDERNVKIFCSRNDDLVVKFRNIFEINHLLKDGNVQGDDNIVFTPGDFPKQLLEIKGNPLLVKNTQGFGNNKWWG